MSRVLSRCSATVAVTVTTLRIAMSRLTCPRLSGLSVLFGALCCCVFGNVIDLPRAEAKGPDSVQMLNKLHGHWTGKRFKALLEQLDASHAPTDLQDLWLFLRAEALHGLGRREEADAAWRSLTTKFPTRPVTARASLPWFLARAKTPGIAVNDLLSTARRMTTPYRKGRALQEIVSMLSPGRERSNLAIEAIDAYRAASAFYQTVDECKTVLDDIFRDPGAWNMLPIDWWRLAQLACDAGLTSTLEKALATVWPGLDNDAVLVKRLLQADILRRKKNHKGALEVLAQVIAAPPAIGHFRALAFQERGHLRHLSGEHAAATADYRQALAQANPWLDVTAIRYRLMRSEFHLGHDAAALEIAETLVNHPANLGLLPVHLYEMGLSRFDEGQAHRSVPWFMLLARSFPGHHRADDALGYAAQASGLQTPAGRDLLTLLRAKYPHSFFSYWFDPPARELPLPADSAQPTEPATARQRIEAWKKLLPSAFAFLAREEIYEMLDADGTVNLGLYRLTMRVAAEIGDGNLQTALGERMLRKLLEQGKAAAQMPIWAWQAHYPRPYWAQVRRAADKEKIDPYWVLSIMREESHFQPTTLSRSNAMGLMQILPTTGGWIAGKLGRKGFKKDQLWDIDTNIPFGCWYLAYLKNLFNGDLFLAAAAYNGGQGNIQRRVEQGPHAAMPVLERLDRVPLPETRDYFKKVMGSYWNYRRLYSNELLR